MADFALTFTTAAAISMFNPPSSRDVSPQPSPPESVRTAPVVPIPSRLEAREAKRKLRKTIGCLCCVALLTVASILIGFSVAIVEYNHVGVLHDTITHHISEQVWGEGRHFVGLGRVFYQYPQRTRLLDFSWLDGTTSYGGDATSIYDADGLAGFTADGQHVTAAVTVFYRLRRDEVRDLYLTLGNAWEGRLADVARQSLLETWSLFETDAFYTRRQAINAAMVSSVNASLHQFHAEATIVSMRQLKFAEQARAPPRSARRTRSARRAAPPVIPFLSPVISHLQVDDAIVEKITTAQRRNTILMEAETRVVRATTAEYVAAADADIVRVLGAAEATGVGYRAAADADAFKTVAAAEATLMGSLRDSLIGSNAATLRMRYVSTVIGAPRTRLFIGDVHMSARAALPRCRCNTRACTDGDCRVYDSAGGRGACVDADNRLASHREGMGWVVPTSAC